MQDAWGNPQDKNAKDKPSGYAGLEANGDIIAGVNTPKDIACERLTVNVTGASLKGKTLSDHDIEIGNVAKGLILRSPNGHRWRLLISNVGLISGFDLDA